MRTAAHSRCEAYDQWKRQFNGRPVSVKVVQVGDTEQEC